VAVVVDSETVGWVVDGVPPEFTSSLFVCVSVDTVSDGDVDELSFSFEWEIDSTLGSLVGWLISAASSLVPVDFVLDFLDFDFDLDRGFDLVRVSEASITADSPSPTIVDLALALLVFDLDLDLDIVSGCAWESERGLDFDLAWDFDLDRPSDFDFDFDLARSIEP